MGNIEYLWKDRKRYFGLPISFTRYRLSEDRIFREKGLLNLREEEVLLYRVRDLEVTRSLWQRIFRVGTVCVHSSDKTSPHLDLENVRDPKQVKELIFEKVEQAAIAQGLDMQSASLEELDALWDAVKNQEKKEQA